MDWQWVLGALVFGSIGLAVYVQYLTQRTKIENSSHPRRRRRFRPDWERRKGERKPGVRIER